MNAQSSGFPMNHLLLKICTFLLLVIAACPLKAQDIKVRGHFTSDSTEIGRPVYFCLTARYPSNTTILFPDSTFSFAPFEWVSKTYAVTHTTAGISYDSVTYRLTTYEIDSIQTLKLPVFMVQQKDCTQFFTSTDTLFLKQLVSKSSLPDSLSIEKLPLKVNTSYLPVSWQLNYVIVGIAAAVLLAITILVWVFYGKKIKRHFALKKLSKNYTLFLEKYDRAVDALNSNFSPSAAEATLLMWKKYLESLMAKPYTKYTSKEIREMEENESLGHALASIDRMIYANRHESTTPFYSLKDHVYQQFEKKKTELMHG
jgi:hypothetical protein